MAIAYRSGNSTGGSSSASTVLTAPAGLADGDIILIGLYKENTNAVTWPAGFAEVAAITAANSSFVQYVAWKRASGESGNYTASWTGSVWRDSVILAYSGCIASGDPNDTTPTTVASGVLNNIATVPSIDPVASDDMLVVFGTNYGSSGPGSWTGAPAGMNLRDKQWDIASADLLLSSGSPTGTKDFGISANGESTGISMVLKALLVGGGTAVAAWWSI